MSVEFNGCRQEGELEIVSICRCLRPMNSISGHHFRARPGLQ